jgi:uncharacterized protein (TIGR02001 family)
MRTSFAALTGLLLVTAAPALAQDEPKAFTVTGGATLVTDYRFRGISQTDKDFAVQGTFTVAHESGIYATVWGSSVDDYVAAGSDQEIDLSAGFKKTFGGTTVDIGGLYYYYPGAEKIVPGYASDFLELYGSVAQTFGPVTGKVLVAYAPKSSALDYGFGKEDNLYANASLSGGIPGTPVSVSAGVGRTFTRSFLSGGIKYTDWSLGASYTTGPLTFGVSYVDTNKRGFSPSGKNIYKGGVVGSVGVAF